MWNFNIWKQVSLFRILAAIFIFFGLHSILNDIIFLSNSDFVKGKIIRLESVNTGRTSLESIVVEYVCLDGGVKTVISSIKSNRLLAGRIGEQRDVAVNRQSFQAKIASFEEIFFLSIMLIIGGISILILESHVKRKARLGHK